MYSLSRPYFFRSVFCLIICVSGLVSADFIVASGQEDTSWQAKYLPKEKEDKLNQKAAREPKDAKILFQLADAYLGVDRWADAASALEQVVQLKPDSAVAYYYLGICYGYLDKKEDAVRAYQKAAASKSLELFGDKILSSEPLQNLASEYEALRLYDEAIATWNELVRRGSPNEQALCRIGLIYVAQGKREEALQIAAQLSASNRELLLKKLASPSSANVENNATIFTSGSTSPATFVRPTILYRERAPYSHFARVRKIQGSVVLRLNYNADGHISNVEVIRPLPYGLTTEAIRTVKKIRFQPATKDGKPVSVRGNVEFNFTLY